MTLWYLMRGLGFSALIVLTAATTLGALSTHGSTGPAGLDRRVVRQLLHRSTAAFGLVLLTLHLVTVVLDASVPVSLGGVLLPFTAGYRAVAMGLGTLALYAIVLAAVSGIARGSFARLPGGDRLWRGIHASAYAAWGLAMLHSIFGGSDARQTWAVAVYVACVLSVSVALTLRMTAEPRRTPDHRGHRRLTAPTGVLR